MSNNFSRFNFSTWQWENSTGGPGGPFTQLGKGVLGGADASKPAAGIADRLYIAIDTKKIYVDDGEAWVKKCDLVMVGTSIGDVVQLEDDGDGNPALPAVDGSQLKNTEHWNFIKNGNFDVKQRPGAWHGAYEYGADCWRGGAGTTHGRVADTPDVYSENSYQMERSFNNPWVAQVIESIDAIYMVGKPVTLSFQARTFGGDGDVRVDLRYLDIKDDASTGTTRIQRLANPTVFNNWTPHTFYFNPLPQEAENGVWLRFENTANDADPVGMRICQVRMHIGDVEIPWRARPISLEQALCQRYLRIISRGAPGVCWSESDIQIGTVLDPPMRTTPDVTILEPDFLIISNSIYQASGASLKALNAGANGWRARIDGFSGLTAGNGVLMHSVDAIELSAEI